MLPNEKFALEHEDEKIDYGTLASLFLRCQKRGASSSQEAYEHAFGKDGKEGCYFCNKLMKRQKRLSRWDTGSSDD